MIKQFIGPLSEKEKRIKQLYRFIREQGPVSKGELIEEMGLSQTTCTRLIDELHQKKLIIESGLGESSGGRKPITYQITPDLYYLIGIDISRTHTKVILMDLSLNVMEQVKLTMNKETTPEVTIQFIEAQIEDMLNKRQTNLSKVLGIGIGAIGPLDREKGMILSPIDFLAPGWGNVRICDTLSEKFNLPILLDIGVNTALLAEYQNGLWKKYNDIAYVIQGVGTRLGVITDGHLSRGAADRLGMFGQGHMVVEAHGRKCVCGGYGCIQAYASISAIKKEVIQSVKRGHDSILRDQVHDIEKIEFNDICQAVNNHDPLCSHLVKDAAYYDAISLSNLINVLLPEMMILAGPVYTEMDLFYETVIKATKERYSVIYPGHKIEFNRGILGENAVAIGAGSIVFDYYLK
ncbi:putative NBD/HSP70 family sugar kinase [Scopulibacillus darangshiensis]|uniref:Putative NBD/HSP70 family sugar kinase n=1 Tax=Scopulibacillus darangshiensis TaxID=442528 RepID=A0A4R2P7M0_9BACL|nr:ROK family transcriptional regulator [Scopulibacillus darangshiensis]TCP30892.1 putative NBD/HSP70 family sugar kinase [Scopulibacillus darangshiensis]